VWLDWICFQIAFEFFAGSNGAARIGRIQRLWGCLEMDGELTGHSELKSLLVGSAAAGWSLMGGKEAVWVTASTVETFSTVAEATAAAEQLLKAALALGYELRAGSIGAAMPVEGRDDLWCGRLADVVLIADIQGL
jgi:hypothetical protein